MADKPITIFNRRLASDMPSVIQFLDHGIHELHLSVENGEPVVITQPDTGIPLGEFRSVYGAPQQNISAADIASIRRGGWIGYLETFWLENTLVQRAAVYEGDGPFARHEYLSGQVRLTQRRRSSAVDVSIICGWPPMRPNWEWVAKRLQKRFKTLRKGGPEETPDEDMKKAVLGWRAVKGRMYKFQYAKTIPVSVNRLTIWEKDLVERKIIPDE